MAKIQVLQPMTIRFDGRNCNEICDNCDNYMHDGYYPNHEDGNICLRFNWNGRSNLKYEGGNILRHEKCIKEFGEE